MTDYLDLVDLGDRHDTDKVAHQYFKHYAPRFADLRDKDVTVLEIGVMKGASLRTWRDFFARGMIYGIDAVEESVFAEDRITVYQGRQEDPEFLARVVAATGPLDIVIDDGSHCSRHHVVSFAELWPHVKPWGWYAIEDCQSIFNSCWTLPGEQTILDALQERHKDILTGQGDIAEVCVIGDGINDGLIFIRKRGDAR